MIRTFTRLAVLSLTIAVGPGCTSAPPTAAAHPAALALGFLVPVQDMNGEPVSGDGIFRPLGDDAARHVQSGMVCPTKGDGIQLIRLFVHPTTPPGHDVGCDYGNDGGGKTTLYATAVDPAMASRAYGQQIASEIRTFYRDAVPAEGPMVATPTNLPQIVGGAFRVTSHGKPMITSFWATVVQGWGIEVRSTYPESTRSAAEARAAAFCLAAELWVFGAQQDRPAT